MAAQHQSAEGRKWDEFEAAARDIIGHLDNEDFDEDRERGNDLEDDPHASVQHDKTYSDTKNKKGASSHLQLERTNGHASDSSEYHDHHETTDEADAQRQLLEKKRRVGRIDMLKDRLQKFATKLTRKHASGPSQINQAEPFRSKEEVADSWDSIVREIHDWQDTVREMQTNDVTIYRAGKAVVDGLKEAKKTVASMLQFQSVPHDIAVSLAKAGETKHRHRGHKHHKGHQKGHHRSDKEGSKQEGQKRPEDQDDHEGEHHDHGHHDDEHDAEHAVAESSTQHEEVR
ncbi:unnamed protein product [Amoebophrya sp. A25]|nr:unnamed protein product [Amoebophrya sp. A25]|eukprot:GSA25T00011690001.1